MHGSTREHGPSRIPDGERTITGAITLLSGGRTTEFSDEPMRGKPDAVDVTAVSNDPPPTIVLSVNQVGEANMTAKPPSPTVHLIQY